MSNVRNTESSGDSKLDNGYPFRDDIINFHLKYKGKKYYFEFPVLIDRSFLLREIKTRTGVRGSFSLRWQEWDEKSQQEKEKSTKLKEKPKRLADVHKEAKGEEICIHSTYITTLALVKFCGYTLTIIDGNDSKKSFKLPTQAIFHFISIQLYSSF